MKKTISLLISLSVVLVSLSACTKVETYNFVDYGINQTTNEVVKSKNAQTIAWVYQEASGEKLMNKIFLAETNGSNKVELVSMELAKGRNLRVLGLYPETSVFIYAIESENPDFGQVVQRETFYKFFNEEASKGIGKDYFFFFETDRGVTGLRVGDVVATYQLSMKNAYAIDAVSNYNKEKKIKAIFTDAKITSDLQKVVYTFEYEPATQGYNQNKLMVSDLSGTNRKELIASDKAIDIVEMLDNNRVKAKVGEEEKEFTF